MKYIDMIKLPSSERINRYFCGPNRCLYPWTIFFQNGLEHVICRDITIFYGNNGSGKSTLLNLISEKLCAQRGHDLFKDVIYDDYSTEVHPFDDFLKEIEIEMACEDVDEKITLPSTRRLITSDDIFKRIGERVRHNRMTLEKIDNARDAHKALKGKESRLKGIDDFEEFSKIIEAKKMSKARYARVHAPNKEIMRSNGETALDYYQHAFEDEGIFLLDEPENCLSPIFQIELTKIIEEASR